MIFYFTAMTEKPLRPKEVELLFEIASEMKNSLPCTACRYCCAECPKVLDIPMLLGHYNEVRFSPAINIGMRMDAVQKEKLPSACIGCGECSKMCPQNIDIPLAMKKFSDALAKMPSWADFCRQREKAQK